MRRDTATHLSATNRRCRADQIGRAVAGRERVADGRVNRVGFSARPKLCRSSIDSDAIVPSGLPPLHSILLAA